MHAAGKNWQAYLGNAIPIIAQLVAEKTPIDLIITDPPYGTGATTIIDRQQTTAKKYTSRKTPAPDFSGDATLPDCWEMLMIHTFTLAAYAATPNAALLAFCDWRSYPRLLAAIGAAGWIPKGAAIWDKGPAARPQPYGFRKQAEFIIHARKRNFPTTLTNAPYLPGILRYDPPRNRLHQVEKPLALLRELATLCPPDGTILDPFQGAGTTGLAALMENRRYIGIEINPTYHAIACKRLTDFENQTHTANQENQQRWTTSSPT